MKRRATPPGHRCAAQAVIEFAVIVLFMVPLAFGGMALYEVGRVQMAVDAAAIEAARAAVATRPAVGTNPSTVFAQARSAANQRARAVLDEAGLAAARASVSIDGDLARVEAPQTKLVSATVTYAHQLTPTSSTVLKAWYPTGLAQLKGHAYEPVPNYASSW